MTFETEAFDKEFHLTFESLQNFELPNDFIETDSSLQTNMKQSSAVKKCEYLIQQGYELPSNWYNNPETGLEISNDSIACINTLYSLIAKAKGIGNLVQRVKIDEMSVQDAIKDLNTTNVWLNKRIEREFGWRQKILVKGEKMTIESLHRLEGNVVNTNSEVSEDELIEIVNIFKKHFIRI